jgi:benzodiazapine receptor
MKNLLILSACIALPLAVGGLSGYLTVGGLAEWYVNLKKPAFNPPGWIFGPVWTLLYALMGVSLYMVIKSVNHELKTAAYAVFAVQLALNFWWSFIFFNSRELGWALFEILVLWVAILALILLFYRISKPAALLQIPYLLWVSFATILNATLWWMNKT